MENFNKFQPLLDDDSIPKFGRKGIYRIFAAEGNREFMSDQVWKYVDGVGGSYVKAESLKDRKDESERKTNLSLLVYDTSSKSLDWKCTYRNSKGVYFKKHRDKFYV